LTDSLPDIVVSLLDKLSRHELMTLSYAAIVFKRHGVINTDDSKLLWKANFIKYNHMRDSMFKDFSGQFYSIVSFTTRGFKGTEDIIRYMELSDDVFLEIEDPFAIEESELGLPVKFLMTERRLRKELTKPVIVISNFNEKYELGYIEGFHPEKRYHRYNR